MEETDLVVFEEIFYQGDLYERKSVAEHSDLMDEEQSVSIPKIKTDMSDAKTGLKLANAETEMTLHDTVRYSGLVFQKTYFKQHYLKLYKNVEINQQYVV